jgi:hypothetical protein
VILYWDAADLKKEKGCWKPYRTGNATFESSQHYTYKQYYARLPWILRTQVIRLEKLSDAELIQRVVDLSR